MKCLGSIISALALLFSGTAHCSNEVVAQVVAVGTYGNGNVYVALDRSIDEPGCSIPYLELPSNGPAAKSVLATATLAVATSLTVRVKTDNCFNGSPSFSGGRGGYFALIKP